MKPITTKSVAAIAAGIAVPAAASLLTRRLAGRSYQAFAMAPPPRNPEAPGVTWKQAILWTALSGALGGVGRMIARKALAQHGVPTEGHGLGSALRSIIRR